MIDAYIHTVDCYSAIKKEEEEEEENPTLHNMDEP